MSEHAIDNGVEAPPPVGVVSVESASDEGGRTPLTLESVLVPIMAALVVGLVLHLVLRRFPSSSLIRARNRVDSLSAELAELIHLYESKFGKDSCSAMLGHKEHGGHELEHWVHRGFHVAEHFGVEHAGVYGYAAAASVALLKAAAKKIARFAATTPEQRRLEARIVAAIESLREALSEVRMHGLKQAFWLLVAGGATWALVRSSLS